MYILKIALVTLALIAALVVTLATMATAAHLGATIGALLGL